MVMGFYGSQDGDLEALEAEYPARAKAEADARCGETWEAYQQRVAQFPDVRLVPNQDGDVEYVEVRRNKEAEDHILKEQGK